MIKWVCKQYRPYPNDQKPPIGEKWFDTEEEAINFYNQSRSAQKFVGQQAPHWGYPVKVEISDLNVVKNFELERTKFEIERSL